MFGQYFRNLDEKNRVMIPSKLRKKLGKVVYLTLGFDQVMELRSEPEFKIFSGKLLNTNMLSAKARNLTRAFLCNTMEVEIDKQGRVSLPTSLKIDVVKVKKVVFVGVGSKVELWSPAAWEATQKTFKKESSLEQIASDLQKEGEKI